MVGAIASAAYFFSTVHTNTSDFTERLKRRPKPMPDVEHTLPEKSGNSADQAHDSSSSMVTNAQLEKLAQRMAHKVYERNGKDNLNKAPVLHGPARLQQMRAARKGDRGRAHQIASATAHYAGDLTKTGLKSAC